MGGGGEEWEWELVGKPKVGSPNHYDTDSGAVVVDGDVHNPHRAVGIGMTCTAMYMAVQIEV